ncbi:DUF3156 family protein [Pseudomonas chengduensis]|uniref:DUF3156 family protein n=1 Tax=Ectopseudomonas oleovorans TaxID=301 RepID=A0AA42TVV6_ECTOL|nr:MULTISPECIES: DUF3156 family protein [Pseudomonas]MDH1338146.1 DUF3156 family protein [Pseudomonas oleovorans]MDH1493956.1 DUF3156 family protein [Pseudomonas oleovorans]MDH1681716.1 DUF3156 family protein [Pseudomonas chengduensis]WGG20075.1 DUF3156 family protein [Pseudomonas oleovorans]
MNLFGNVERRAQHAFRHLCTQFGQAPSAADPLQALDEQPGIARRLDYYVRRQFFSRIYKLDVRYTLHINGVPEGQANWVKGRIWKSPQRELEQWLNQSLEMTESLRSLDTELVELSSEQGRIELRVRPLPGCFVWTLLPPMHYFVRMKENEVALISALPAQLQARP